VNNAAATSAVIRDLLLPSLFLSRCQVVPLYTAMTKGPAITLHEAICIVLASPELLQQPAVRVLLEAAARATLNCPSTPGLLPTAAATAAVPPAPAETDAADSSQVTASGEFDLAQPSVVVTSSDFHADHAGDRVKMGRGYRGGGGAQGWRAAFSDDQQHVTFWFPRMAQVVGVSTAGRPDFGERVTEYYVDYTTDGRTWRSVDDARIFPGNTDQCSVVRNNFPTLVQAVAIRIKPRRWIGEVSMRAAVHGWLL